MGNGPDAGDRIAPSSGVGHVLYLEAGIGVHLLSHASIDARDLSTAFQFGEFAGIGVNFGEHSECGIGLRIQHLSNARIKQPNDGVTFGQLRVSYRWE